MKFLIPFLLVLFWTSACVCIQFESKEPAKDWKFVPMPELLPEPEFDFGPLEPDEPVDLKLGPHVLQFDDFVNPLIKWEIDYYELYDQWGRVIAKIQPNERHRYVVKGVPKGCFRLRAIGRDWKGQVPSMPSNEGCTPGLKTGRIWT